MKFPRVPVASVLALATAAWLSDGTAALAKPKVPLPRPRPVLAAGSEPAAAGPATPAAPHSKSSAPATPAAAAPSPDLGAVKHALELIHRGKTGEATAVEAGIHDPAAKRLVEWAILRSDENNNVGFDRYLAFISANPGWPSVGMLRRRAEAALFQEGRSPATVLAFFAKTQPLTPRGKFALARALLAQGDRAAAQFYVRDAWRYDAFSDELEKQALELFREFITRADHVARMDDRFSALDVEGGMRAARRLGDVELAIAKARAAVIGKAANAGQQLDAVPEEGRSDPGYLFSRIQWLRRGERIAEATQLMLAAPRSAAVLHNLDEWWIERRLICRKLLDLGDAETAYRIARDAAPPSRENYRGEHQFTAGWIALRFLNDPELAMPHFARIAQGITNPITLARAEYWQGRAAEAAHRPGQARAHYEASARYPTAYYGQIARGRLGLANIALRRLPVLEAGRRAAVANLDVLRAAEMLYAIGARHLVLPFVADLADRMPDPHAMEMLAQIAERREDARAMLLIGKGGLAQGFAVDPYAFPTIGVPHFGAIGPEVERSVIYSIVRQESAFDQNDVSTAQAMGLMQVTPEAGRHVASRFGVRYDQKKLRHDAVYNTQMGAAELGELLQIYRGSYILAFAAYNAGQGRVKEWLERYGDPRDPAVDPIDWVERIPFAETRNYVQRVMENLQVYRIRFGGGSRLMIEADLYRGATVN
jgi:soluble lytic murein transglycosylase